MAQIQVPVYGLQRTVDVPQESMRDLVDYYVKVRLRLIWCISLRQKKVIVDLHWLKHLWDRGNLFETWVLRATEGKSLHA